MKQIAIIGQSYISPDEQDIAEFGYAAGKMIAEMGLILLNGGMGGIMEESARGAKAGMGSVIAILPGNNRSSANRYSDFHIVTNMGHSRNIVLVSSADAVIAIGGKHGTLIEIAAALKLNKPIAGYHTWDIAGIRTIKTDGELKLWLQDIVKE